MPMDCIWRLGKEKNQYNFLVYECDMVLLTDTEKPGEKQIRGNSS